jgi:hypothetical protein
MDSDGETISVLEKLLGEKERRRKCWKKHLCCCFYKTKQVKINSTAIVYDGRTSEYMDDRGGEHCGTIAN